MRDLFWIGSSLEDVKQFPEEVRREVGYALYAAQCGLKHPHAKPLKGFAGGSVLEIVESFDTNAYRAIYTVRLSSGVYVLHAFQKKSTQGIKTARRDIDLIEDRMKVAIEDDKQRSNRS
jgi:phage-related protein